MTRLALLVPTLALMAGCASASGYEFEVPSSTELEPGVYEFMGTVQVRDVGGSFRSSAGVRTEDVTGTVEVLLDGSRRMLGSSHRATRLSISPRSRMGTVSVPVEVTQLEQVSMRCAGYEPGPGGRCLVMVPEYEERRREVRFSGTAYIIPVRRATR